MVTAVRAEAIITAQNKLRPGLASAAAELSRFRQMQSKATAAFGATAVKAQAVAARASTLAIGAQSRLAAIGRNQLVTLGGPAALAASYKQFADVDRQISRVGITANASADELSGVRGQIEGIAYETAQSSGKVTGGLDVLVAQGRTLKESLEFLPSVARTAAAAGAEVEDIAKSADAVSSNFKIAGKDMQAAFDVMAEGGKAGQFELKDMARYLPSLAPASSAVGFTGQRGLTDLVAMLQVMRKGTGSAEEAVASMSNIFQKMESEETTKRFSKFGVDLAAGMAKGRKEGRNLIEVFEELANQALKGDLSKLPQLFSDAEFARGVRALLTYRGEWQKLSNTIGETATGSVARDLTKVTKDARAQIDRMFGALENRAVQLGGFLAKHIVLPLDEGLKRIEAGENKAVNIASEGLKYASANLIANQELDGAKPGAYSDETRKLVDARKEFLLRQRIDAERESLGGRISGLQGERAKAVRDGEAQLAGKVLPAGVRKTIEAKTKLRTDEIDGQIAQARTRLGDINRLVGEVDELNLKLAEAQGQGARVTKPRMSQPNQGPGFAYVGPGATSFVPTLGGGGAAPSVAYGGVPISQVEPPIRPAELSAKPSSSAEIASALGEAKTKADEVRSSVEGIGGAGQSAGATMASGFSAGLSQMESDLAATVTRMQQRLNTLRAPTLSIGGGAGGFDTGKQGPN
ncbi:phage tail tape measure protein [Bosea sp. BK604]|uniref:phage tail tape measure protein n=1 Tax=Bosea sp. BK604 TaxID=2512180 RepID=UPI001044B7BA|nr:phage tail tape measure protein [Bosea sp. BK604]TCR69690.1 TP901 family phage tail tape measure protein [Bosea sp. BK604]